jgi:hypothetical protein
MSLRLDPRSSDPDPESSSAHDVREGARAVGSAPRGRRRPPRRTLFESNGCGRAVPVERTNQARAGGPRGEWIRRGGAAGRFSGGRTSSAIACSAGRKRHTVAGISSPPRLQPVQYEPSASACESPASNECKAPCAGPQASNPTTSATTRPTSNQRAARERIPRTVLARGEQRLGCARVMGVTSWSNSESRCDASRRASGSGH